MMTPEVWAKKATTMHGPAIAHSIAASVGRSMIGQDASVPNPHFKYYERIRNWITNRYEWDAEGRWKLKFTAPAGRK